MLMAGDLAFPDLHNVWLHLLEDSTRDGARCPDGNK